MENTSNGINDQVSMYPSIQLENVSLLEVASALRDEMHTYFKEVNIDVVACPCLTRKPFNLAGIGLNGNPLLMNVGTQDKFILNPQHQHVATWNLQNILSSTCYDSFIIGSGYAVKPHMPYNGHLVINATYRAPANFTNDSRIIFADANKQRKIKMLTEPNQMKCSFSGNFFISEGMAGQVIRVRAKGRKSESDIITVMQNTLYDYFQERLVGLGGVLQIRNGIAMHHLHPEVHPPISSFTDLVRSYQSHNVRLKSDVIAVGTLLNVESYFIDLHPEPSVEPLTRRRSYQFNSFSDYEAGGQFIRDITADTTEYEGYFNVAKKMIHSFEP